MAAQSVPSAASPVQAQTVQAANQGYAAYSAAARNYAAAAQAANANLAAISGYVMQTLFRLIAINFLYRFQFQKKKKKKSYFHFKLIFCSTFSVFISIWTSFSSLAFCLP